MTSMILWEKLCFEIYGLEGAQNEVLQILWKVNALNLSDFFNI